MRKVGRCRGPSAQRRRTSRWIGARSRSGGGTTPKLSICFCKWSLDASVRPTLCAHNRWGGWLPLPALKRQGGRCHATTSTGSYLQHSSGGKERLGRISKMGDQYLRRLLITGLTSLLRRNMHHSNQAVERRDTFLLRKRRIEEIAHSQPSQVCGTVTLARDGTRRRRAIYPDLQLDGGRALPKAPATDLSRLPERRLSHLRKGPASLTVMP